jgi:pyruvate/2-oxoglutarate dehydrogenase complex dihydrolipoamide dehydrogenase (E3) component
MTEVECDVVVLGLGPGGEHVAIKLGRAGLDVIGVEDRLVGGECPYFGCVPSKMMIAAAHMLAAARRVPDFGGTSTVRPDWGPVAKRIRDEATDDWDDAAAVKRLEDNGGRFHRGRGVLDGPGRVRVGDTTYVARKGVVLNTGTAPAAPPIDGLQGTPYWTNRDAVAVAELPASLVVLGGGPIGCEFAQVFSRFGVRVTVVEGADRLVAIEEPEASALLAKAFEAEGIDVRAEVDVASVSHGDDGFTLDLGGEKVTAEKLLVATGR